MDNKLDGAINFLDAGNAFKKADPQGTSHFTLHPEKRLQLHYQDYWGYGTDMHKY
jgi:hypothetical protein